MQTLSGSKNPWVASYQMLGFPGPITAVGMALRSRGQLGPGEIVSPLSEEGMGGLYRSRDIGPRLAKRSASP